MCEQLAHGRIREAERPGLEPATSRLQIRRPDQYATTPHTHGPALVENYSDLINEDYE